MAAAEGSDEFGDILDMVPIIPSAAHLQELDSLAPGAAEVGQTVREHALKEGATAWEARIRGAGAAAGFAIGQRTLELKQQ
jgi:hypothetical protein